MFFAAIAAFWGVRDEIPVEWNRYRALTDGGIGQTFLHIDWSSNIDVPWRLSVFLAQLALLLLVGFGARRRVPDLRLLAYSSFGILLPLGVGYIATEVLGSVSLAKLMWMRAGDFLCLLALLLPLALAGHSNIIGARGLRISMAALGFLIVYPAYANPAWYWAVVLIVCILYSQLTLPGVSQLTARVGKRGNLCLGSMALAFSLFLFTPKAVAFAQPEYDQMPWYKDFIKTQAWARENSPKSSVFLTPVYLSGWRVFSQRSSFLELRDRAAVAISDKVMTLFLNRSQLLGMPQNNYQNTDPFVARYYALPDDLLKKLYTEQQVSYAVFEVGKPTTLPIIYRNESFKVVALYPMTATSR